MRLFHLIAILVAFAGSALALPPQVQQQPFNGGTVASPVNAPSYQIGGTTVLATPNLSANGVATLVGASAGLGINSSAIEATCVGLLSCGAQGAGMTGTENTAAGWHSQSFMTSGQFNTSLGVNTMGFETTGSNNVAVGTDSMRNAVGQANSVALGVNTMYQGNGGSSVAIGVSALRGSLQLASATVATGGSGCSNGSQTFTISGGTATTAAQVTGTVSGGVLSGSLSVAVSGVYTVAPSTPASSTGGSCSVQPTINIVTSLLSTGANNIAIGSNALTGTAMTTANSNVGIGNNTMSALTTASADTVVGYNAAASITTGGNSVYIGSGAGTQITTAGNNVVIGANAMSLNGATTAAGNVAIGVNTLKSNASNDNVAIGQNTAQTFTGSHLTAVGSQAAAINGSASEGTFIGFKAGNNVNASNNTFIGSQVGSLLTVTGTGNILLGTSSGVDLPAAATSNYLNIGNVITATGVGTGVGSVVTVPGTLSFGTLTGTTCTNSGFITINDNGGTARKLMVCT